LNITISEPFNPWRGCRKNTGPRDSNLMAILTRRINGAVANRRRRDKTMSSVRFTNAAVRFSGAWQLWRTGRDGNEVARYRKSLSSLAAGPRTVSMSLIDALFSLFRTPWLIGGHAAGVNRLTQIISVRAKTKVIRSPLQQNLYNQTYILNWDCTAPAKESLAFPGAGFQHVHYAVMTGQNKITRRWPGRGPRRR